MIDVSQRPSSDLIWAMDEWLKTPGLDAREVHIISAMKDFLIKGHTWELIKHSVVVQHFQPLLSAIAKARTAGILKEWRT